MIDSLQQVADKFKSDIQKNSKQFLGIRNRNKVFEGSVIIENELGYDVLVSLQRSSAISKTILQSNVKVAAGEPLKFDPETTSSNDFDFRMTVRALPDKPGASRGKIIGSSRVDRGGRYKLKASEGKSRPVTVEIASVPARERSDKLAQVKGISFGLSASGWLFVYQLGVAECLQNHGLHKNPYARIAGASGGALTGALLMYGASMPSLRDIIKQSADKVHGSMLQNMNLRQFVLDACKQLVYDGSYKHPAFQEGRVDICYSAFDATDKRVEQERANQFEDSGDAIIALLASSTMGISGMPFGMTTQDGRQVTVADGAVTQFLPVVDEHTISVKPFSDLFNMTTWGKEADVTPSEFVPTPWGIMPPSLDDLDHLYELGYQDMELWLHENLDKRIEQIEKAHKDANTEPEPDKGPVQFQCDDDGKSWVDKVERIVPVTWNEMTAGNASFKSNAVNKVVKHGRLEIQTVDVAEDEIGDSGTFMFSLTGKELTWCSQEEEEMPPQLSDGPPAPNIENRIPVCYMEEIVRDRQHNKLVTISTSEAKCVGLLAPSSADAKAWYSSLVQAKKDHDDAQKKPARTPRPDQTRPGCKCAVQ